jgi:hypothetical protein
MEASIEQEAGIEKESISPGITDIREFGCDDHKRVSRGTITTFIST